ncbi:MAG: hypothetical protein K8R90_01855 [Candidatus Cloacimonetes bacterium]|nr:hypothetical protein [Candidatus Cloacimonadota bacterium]
MRQITAILLLLTFATGLTAATEDWVGQWIDEDTQTVFTVELRGETPTVISSLDLDDNTTNDVVRSQWEDGQLSWTIYIADTEVTLSYSGLSMQGDRMNTTWQNNWSDGAETLYRYGFSGVWADTDINVYNTIEQTSDGYIVTRVEDRDDGIDYEIGSQSYEDGVLTWTFNISSTDVNLTYSASRRDGNTLEVTWENDMGNSGEDALHLEGEGGGEREGGGEPVNAADLVGVWSDPSIDVLFYIYITAGEPAVTFVYDTDEMLEYEVTEQSWIDGVLEWTIDLPATVLTYRTTGLDGTSLHTDWWNDTGSSGEDDVIKIDNPLVSASSIIGEWTDTDIDITFTVESVRSRPTVSKAFDNDIESEIEVMESYWSEDGVLRWEIYIEETEAHITYWANALLNGILVCTWDNEYGHGIERLRSGDTACDDLAGTWISDGSNTEYVIDGHGDMFSVMSIVDLDDGERYPVRSQEYSDGSLTFTYYVPSTEYTVHVEITSWDNYSLHYNWENDYDNGSDTMSR